MCLLLHPSNHSLLRLCRSVSWIAFFLFQAGLWLTAASGKGITGVVKACLHADSGIEQIKDSGFETGIGWSKYTQGFVREPSIVHAGSFAIECVNTANSDARGAVQMVALHQSIPTPVHVAGWSRASGVSDSSDSDYSLYLDIAFEDGTFLWGQAASFSTGDHDWERRELTVLPEKPIKTISVYALFRHHTGTAWFDDITLSELPTGSKVGVFDGVPVDTATVPNPEQETRSTGLGSETFRLWLNDADGRPAELGYRGKRIMFPARDVSRSGFFIRDVAADSDFHGFAARVEKGADGNAHQSGRIDALGLSLESTYRSLQSGVEITGRLLDASGKDRAITVYYALPIPAHGLVWWDTLRESRVVKPTDTCAALARIGAGNTGQMSVNPFSCLQTSEMGLSFDLPMDCPRVARCVYDAPAGQYYVAFDLGLTTSGPPATFRFAIAASDPDWGLRAAAKRYMASHPDWFTRRIPNAGIWMPFSRISRLPDFEDFGFAFKEGNDETLWDNAHGIATFRYTEPMTWWMSMPKDAPRDYQAILDYLDLYASGKLNDVNGRKRALATRRSGAFADVHRWSVRSVDEPWSHGALFINNCNPQVPDTPEEPNQAHIAWTQEIARALYDNPRSGTPAGEYLDSLEGWGDTRNFRADQFPYEAESLTFDSGSHVPCILQAVSTYEFTRWMAADVHSRGKWMFANSTPQRFFWFGSLLDVMGTETHWMDGNEYRPDSDQSMLYRRMISGSKPYLLLMNTDFDLFTHDMVEKYFKRSIFYGIFPSLFSPNAAERCYWENASWYNRDRDLFKKFIPLAQDLYLSGWEAVTGVRSSSPDVWVERFGGEDGRPLRLTLFNDGAGTRDVTLRIDPSVIRHVPLNLTDRVAGQQVGVSPEGLFRISLGAGEVAVLG